MKMSLHEYIFSGYRLSNMVWYKAGINIESIYHKHVCQFWLWIHVGYNWPKLRTAFNLAMLSVLTLWCPLLFEWQKAHICCLHANTEIFNVCFCSSSDLTPYHLPYVLDRVIKLHLLQTFISKHFLWFYCVLYGVKWGLTDNGWVDEWMDSWMDVKAY